MRSVPRWLLWVMLAASVIGFADASYLTAKHYLGIPITCSLIAGCEKVTSSQYATIGPVPLALLGALYYLVVFIGLVAYLDTKKRIWLEIVARFTVVGFLASLALVYLQLFVIRAICLYCMASAFTSTVLFVLGMVYLERYSSDRKGVNV